MKVTKLKCTNCHFKFKASVDANDSVECPYCGETNYIQEGPALGSFVQESPDKEESYDNPFNSVKRGVFILSWISLILFGVLVYLVIQSVGLKSRINDLEGVTTSLIKKIESIKIPKPTKIEPEIESGLQPAGSNFYYKNINIVDSFTDAEDSGVNIMGEIENKSGYQYTVVTFSISVYNLDGKVIALEQFYINNIYQEQTKAFKVQLNEVESEQINRIEILVERALK
ncbi:MAG: FxLYD domain-containing protein [Candidatus Hatepunaea meridiana]|nr:FxLYD domain-containing protein [Candidatus Hatepunaea meridiana]